MSMSAAKSYAMRAQKAVTVEEQVRQLAKAIYEIAKGMDDLDVVVRRLKR